MKQKTFSTTTETELDKQVNEFGKEYDIERAQVNLVVIPSKPTKLATVFTEPQIIFTETVWYKDKKEEVKEKVKEETTGTQKCVECKTEKMTKAVVEHSKQEFKKVLCFDCQKLERKKEK